MDGALFLWYLGRLGYDRAASWLALCTLCGHAQRTFSMCMIKPHILQQDNPLIMFSQHFISAMQSLSTGTSLNELVLPEQGSYTCICASISRDVPPVIN